MKKEIIINRTLEETKIAVLEDGRLFDLFIERRESGKILNDIYRAKVQNVVPALGAAFVDIGFGKSAYLDIDDIIEARGEKNIENVLKQSQDVMVQVYKEPINTKGPKVTTDISLPGRLLVYMPLGNGNIGVSRNIESKEESERLKSIISDCKQDIAGGVIARTEAEGVTEADIKNEIISLTRLWESIIKKFNAAKNVCCVYKDHGVVFQTIRDYLSDDVRSVHIDSKKEFKDTLEYVKNISPSFRDRIVLYNGKLPIFKAYKIEEEVKKTNSNKVKLSSGGCLIIQEAESLCAIDVNSGKFTVKSSQEDTAYITNLEAAQEIARQLRLRNIGGIVVIDFIDMRKSSNKQKLLDRLREATKGDKAKIKIWPITSLGLIEMSRERKRESLSSLLGDTCPLCKGVGKILSKETIFIRICDEIDRLIAGGYNGKIKIKLNPDVIDYFRDRKIRLKELFKIDFDIKPATNILCNDYQLVFE
ncbi:MAG: Rne/Rng family ribonuclease [Elusimicrobiota bacterium]|nr:Rne/Rng family ribonuclease [Elusimicrobiota bacterium]